MGKASTPRRFAPVGLALCAMAWAQAGGARAAELPASELTAKTVEAFDRYVTLTEQRVDAEQKKGAPYLWVDAQAEAERRKFQTQLRNGGVVIEQLETRENGKEIKCPDGMIHHWIGTVFVPGVTLDQYLAFVQDYDRHQEFFKPDVARSQLLARHGDDFQVLFRFYKKKFMITSVHDTWHDIRYFRLSPTRGGSRTRTSKILEVENYGEPNERHKPEGKDRGFLWRLYTWWRFEERDGGVYIQCESVTLSREVPLGFMIGPIVRGLSRDSVEFTLGTTRAVLMRRQRAEKGQP